MQGIPPNKERFLAGIAERVSPDRMQALYLFAPIRRGPVETGVAVIAVDPLPPFVEAPELPFEEFPLEEPSPNEGQEGEAQVGASEMSEVSEVSGVPGVPGVFEVPEMPAESDMTEAPEVRARPVVLTARYRHTLKGNDRGKWELDIMEEADTLCRRLAIIDDGKIMIEGTPAELKRSIGEDTVSLTLIADDAEGMAAAQAAARSRLQAMEQVTAVPRVIVPAAATAIAVALPADPM